jgi:hypothetical protein
MAHFDGAAWHRVTTPAVAGGGSLADVVAVSAATAVAVGHTTGAPLVLRWNGASVTRETTPAAANPFLTGAAAAGPGGVWALGYRFDLNAYANRTLAMLGT